MPSTDPDLTPPGRVDLTRFRAAVQLRDRCRAVAVAAHERAGLAPSAAYANSTYDAIADLVREDGVAQLRAKEVVSVAVPQLNNGTQTLVVFAVPFDAVRRHTSRHNRGMTFDEAHAAALGPPLVLTTLDFDAEE